MIRIDLPYPPSANRLWRSFNGRNIKSEEYRTWLKRAEDAIKAARIRSEITGPYHMEIQLVRPDRRRRDATNCIKPLEDAVVQARLVTDDADAQSVKVSWAKGEPVKGGKAHIWIWADAA